jgi:hypothetical protein
MRLERLIILSAGFALLSAIGQEGAQIPPLSFAHAHNDYEHPRPLLDALDQGFCNVEADVWLVEGKLLVAHDREKVDSNRTLQSLYLNPLRERVAKNGGRVHPAGPAFTLMIDFKSESTNTYQALRRDLKDYEPMLTRFHSNRTETNAVTIVISGSRPRELMLTEAVRLAGYDGRIVDLDRGLSPHFAPWISDNWKNVFKWDGSGNMPDEERTRLREITTRTHEQGMKLRFWGAPDLPAVWRELLSARVDLINTDNLAEFRKFAMTTGRR